jgi:hypothetical protein
VDVDVLPAEAEGGGPLYDDGSEAVPRKRAGKRGTSDARTRNQNSLLFH